MTTLAALLLCLQALIAAGDGGGTAANAVHLAMPRYTMTQDAWPNADVHALVLPVLLDFQPVLLQLSSDQSVGSQLRRFCVQHGLDPGRCGLVMQQAMDELIELRGAGYCKRTQQEMQSLPALLNVKNVLLPASRALKPPIYGWLHDEAANLASDLCGFLRSAMSYEQGDDDASKCERPLQEAFDESFKWIYSLPQCEADTGNTLDGDDLSDRVLTIGQMIALLRSKANQSMDETTNLNTNHDQDASFIINTDVSQHEPAIATGSGEIEGLPSLSSNQTKTDRTMVSIQEATVMSSASALQPLIKPTTVIEINKSLCELETALLGVRQLARHLSCDKNEANNLETPSEHVDQADNAPHSQVDFVATFQDPKERVDGLEISVADIVDDSAALQANRLEQQLSCDGDCTRDNENIDKSYGISTEETSPKQNEESSGDVAPKSLSLEDADSSKPSFKDIPDDMVVIDLRELGQQTSQLDAAVDHAAETKTPAVANAEETLSLLAEPRKSM